MTTALLLIDVQRNMLEPPEPVPDADSVAPALADLLTRARTAGVTIVHVRNNGGADDPDLPGSRGWELVHEPFPEEHVIDKFTQDSFAGTGLGDLIPAGTALIVAGMQSDYCVRTTSLAALARGHRVTVARGAHATYPGEQPAAEVSAAVERELAAAGAAVVPSGEITFG